jgi:hypothetical protein
MNRRDDHPKLGCALIAWDRLQAVGFSVLIAGASMIPGWIAIAVIVHVTGAR